MKHRETNCLEEKKPHGKRLQINKNKSPRPPKAVSLRSPLQSPARLQRKSPRSQRAPPIEDEP